MKLGDWVTVNSESDIPPIFRPDGKPTRGRVESIDGALVTIAVPIDGADVDVHSQAVPYEIGELQVETLNRNLAVRQEPMSPGQRVATKSAQEGLQRREKS